MDAFDALECIDEVLTGHRNIDLCILKENEATTLKAFLQGKLELINTIKSIISQVDRN